MDGSVEEPTRRRTQPRSIADRAGEAKGDSLLVCERFWYLPSSTGVKRKRQLFARLAIGLVNVETGMLVALMAW